MSPRQIVRRGIYIIISMAFLIGLSLMLGVARWVRHEPLWYVLLTFLPIPPAIIAVAMHSRRMLKAVP
jgi:hypothetical protein